MPYAIVTKKLPATNTKGARMCATYNKTQKIVPYDFGADLEGNHRSAAYALVVDLFKLRDCSLIHGTLPNGGYVWLFEDFNIDFYKRTPKDKRAENILLARQYMRRWVSHIGIGFHPDTPAADYVPPLSDDDAKQYDLDMLFCQLVLQDPYADGLRAMRDAGLLDAA